MEELYNTAEYLEPLEGFWEAFLAFIPSLIGAVLVFIIGWFFAVGVGKLVAGILTKLKFNSFFESESWSNAMEKADMELDVSQFIGAIVKWILIIVVLWLSVDILGFSQFAELMEQIVGYLPNVIVAALIFVVAVMVADFLSKIMVATTEKADFVHTGLAGAIVKWAIWFFAIFAILIQLGIAEELLTTLFEGLIYMVAIAGGLAFGLGGKDAAANMIDKMKDSFQE
ncbi:MAG: mechanosensitive ion channel family protein [Patescibacteria group bacterium]